MMNDPSVYDVGLTANERIELEELRQLVGNLNLSGVSEDQQCEENDVEVSEL